MKIKIVLCLILGVSLASLSYAQSREPSMGSQTPDSGTSATSTGVWPSVDTSTGAGYGSSDHGNVS